MHCELCDGRKATHYTTDALRVCDACIETPLPHVQEAGKFRSEPGSARPSSTTQGARQGLADFFDGWE